ESVCFSQSPFQAILHSTLQPSIARLTVGFLHIDKQDSPACRVADDLYLAWVLAMPMPALVVLLLGQLPHRLAAQLLEGAADVTHVEEQLLLSGELYQCANAHAGYRAVAEADPPQAVLAVGAHLARRLVK